MCFSLHFVEDDVNVSLTAESTDSTELQQEAQLMLTTGSTH